MTSAYGVFANGGSRVTPWFISEIVAADGRVVFTAAEPQPRPVLDERVAWLISDILSDNQARTPTFGPNSVLRIDRTAAVKTGTTNNFHDNWTVGYTPDLVVGVWVGNSNNEAMVNITGISGAGPIWHQAMRAFLAGEPDEPFLRPPGLVQVEICRLSGLLPGDDCPYRRREWFLAGTQPTATDTFFRRVQVDRRSGRLAAAGTEPAYLEEKLVLDLSPQFFPPGPASRGCRCWSICGDARLSRADAVAGRRRPPGLRLAYPDPNAVFYLSSDLPPEAQRILVELQSNQQWRRLTIWLDGRPLAEFAAPDDLPPYQVWWPLTAGTHALYASGVTTAGQAISSPTTHITVHPPR